MAGPLQLLVDCPACRVECAVVELADPVRQLSFGQCRLCAAETASGELLQPGRRFTAPAEVEAALAAWARTEGESLSDFVAANFGGATAAGVAEAVLAGRPVPTSFDVIAWLFKDRTGGSVALGASASSGAGAQGERPEGWDRGAGGPPVTPPRVLAARAPVASNEPAPSRPPPDPRAATRALVATALADGRVLDAERRVLDQLCDKLGAPRPTSDDWRAWRPLEVGLPPDPEQTIQAMRVLALADRVPDAGEARVIREFARTWRVALPDPVLPPVTIPQKLTASWLGLFGR